MGRKHPNPRLVKIHRSYAVEEIAATLDVHKNTVRAWFKDGLQPIDAHRPALVHGQVLRDFLTLRRGKAKRPCPPGHLYCFRCRAPHAPAEDMAEYLPSNPSSGNVRALCPECGGWMYRRATFAQWDDLRRRLQRTEALGHARIEGTGVPCVNCDSTKEGE